jgi:hypothetical protein
MGRDSGLGLVFFAKPIESVIGYEDTRFFGVNGGEGEVLRQVSKDRGEVSIGTHGRISKGALGNSLKES